MKNHIGANGISAPSAKYIFPILFIITDVRYFGNDKSKKKIDKSIKFIKAAGAGDAGMRGCGGCVPPAASFLEKSLAKTFNILGPFRVA